MGAPSLLEVSGLTVAYGGPPVLRGVDLGVERGDGLVLLGPNGAGKSTFLRALAGLQKPGTGKILLDGRPFRSDNAAHRRRLGLVSHESLLYEGLTARETLKFTAELFGLSPDGSRIEQALQGVGLDWVSERPVRTYSRGMLQRLALARALLHGPALLLLDEPMTGLDPAGRRSMEDLLVGVRDRGAGILMTTHELAYVRPIATRVAFLKQGRIVEEGSADACTGDRLEERYHALYAKGPETRRTT